MSPEADDFDWPGFLMDLGNLRSKIVNRAKKPQDNPYLQSALLSAQALEREILNLLNQSS